MLKSRPVTATERHWSLSQKCIKGTTTLLCISITFNQIYRAEDSNLPSVEKLWGSAATSCCTMGFHWEVTKWELMFCSHNWKREKNIWTPCSSGLSTFETSPSKHLLHRLTNCHPDIFGGEKASLSFFLYLLSSRKFYLWRLDGRTPWWKDP